MSRSRCILVWFTISTTSVAVAHWALASVPADPAAARFDELLVGVAGVALTGCAVWAWVVGTVVVAQVLRHSGRPPRPPRGVPTWAVRVVAAACGVVVLGAGAAQAESGVRAPGTSLGPVHDRLGDLAAGTAQTARADGSLDGLPYPDRAAGADHPAPDPGPASRRHAGLRDDDIVVRAGDSLWRLSARRLGPRASTAEIAAETSALYERNRDVVGPDPDLVHPGDRLRPPRT
ncbi:hypothetical protein ABFT23_20925 [Nocardioides sp. C4-1]|uniref:LysM peptidoglycan-binding domain-containing protein n=1 Tax=Nocardioides sp. C4-1 TaxID=3151851 RepID=UPI003265470E